MAGLHKHNLNFEILPSDDPKTLIFVDSSEYMLEPESPLLEIILPGYSKYFLVNINAKIVNTLNSSTIGFNKVLNQSDLVELPDGIWQFKYKICPYDKVYKIKKDIRLTSLLNKLKELYRNIDLSECQSKEDKDLQSVLIRIHILIEGAKAEVDNNSKKSYDYYQTANKLIQKQLDKFYKNCK